MNMYLKTEIILLEKLGKYNFFNFLKPCPKISLIKIVSFNLLNFVLINISELYIFFLASYKIQLPFLMGGLV